MFSIQFQYKPISVENNPNTYQISDSNENRILPFQLNLENLYSFFTTTTSTTTTTTTTTTTSIGSQTKSKVFQFNQNNCYSCGGMVSNVNGSFIVIVSSNYQLLKLVRQFLKIFRIKICFLTYDDDFNSSRDFNSIVNVYRSLYSKLQN
ncbi:hypothetical protein ACTA71_004044 [Dictyostelium dimigraforme]